MISFHVITDHQPFVSLLSSKINLDLLSHPTFSYAFDAIQCTRSPMYQNMSLITADALSRTPQERPRIEPEVLLTDEVKPQANLVVWRVTYNREAPSSADLDNSMTTCVTGYALLCGRLAQPPILAIGSEAGLKSEKLFHDRVSSATPQWIRLRIPTCRRLAMLDSEGYQGGTRCRSHLGLSLPSGGTDSASRSWRIAARHAPYNDSIHPSR